MKFKTATFFQFCQKCYRAEEGKIYLLYACTYMYSDDQLFSASEVSIILAMMCTSTVSSIIIDAAYRTRPRKQQDDVKEFQR